MCCWLLVDRLMFIVCFALYAACCVLTGFCCGCVLVLFVVVVCCLLYVSFVAYGVLCSVCSLFVIVCCFLSAGCWLLVVV